MTPGPGEEPEHRSPPGARVGPRRAGEEGEGSPGWTARQRVHRGRVVDLSLDRVRFPDGSEGTLDLLTHRGASAVVPFLDDPASPDPRVLLIRQYRYATGGWIWEIPAGMAGPEEESWEGCAQRELEEETGFRARTLRYLTRIYTAPGFTDEVIRIWAGWDLEPGAVQRDRDEFIELAEVRASRVLEMIGSGEIVDAKSLVGLLHAFRFLAGTPGAETGKVS